MKQKIILAILLFISATVSSNAQTCKKPGLKCKTPTPIISKFTGQLVSWTNNDNFMFDGLYLQTSTTKYFVKFPANKASILTAAIKKNSTITIEGVEKTTTHGTKEINLVSLTTDEIKIYDTRDALKLKKEQTAIIKGTGKIEEIQRDGEKNIIGFILDNKVILRMPSHISAQLNADASKGTAISYTGITREMHNGEIASVVYAIIKCKSLILNGKSYILLK